MIVLLTEYLDEVPRKMPGIDVILSCRQHPSVFDGLRITELHLTDRAANYRFVDDVLRVLLRRNMAKSEA